MLAGLLGLLASPAAAQPAGSSQPAPPDQQADLARKLVNPVSDLVSVPFQFNWEQNVGPDDETRFILNVQPVMPFSISSNWNVIARVIVPFVSQPRLFDGGTPAFGVSDVLTSLFFSPKSGGLIWGVGPAISLPSTSIPTLGTGKWSAGPTVVVLKQTGPWTLGALWNQVWSFAGNDARDDVNQMFLQPFLAYQATPKLSTFGVFPASYQFGVGGFPAHPDLGPSWKIRGAIVILLPRR
jgi:hypothetical protein